MTAATDLDLSQLLDSALEAATDARAVLLHYFGELKKVSSKGHLGLVTEADVESEKVIMGVLKEKFPQFALLGEEQAFELGQQSASSFGGRWIIDPLDGTTNFVHKFPIFCISIGFEYKGELVLGVIDAPIMGDTYHAVRRKGAFKNGEKIQVSQRKKLADSLLATGFFAYENTPDIDQQIEILNRLIRKTRGIRRAGAAAYDLCMVAEGIFDGFWEKNLNPWDTAAGTVLVREAGGSVTDYMGDEYDVEMNAILASNGFIHESIRDNITPCLD